MIDHDPLLTQAHSPLDYWLLPDQDGNELWVRQIGTDGDDKAYGIAINDDDEIYLVGATYGDFATGAGISIVPDPFLIKYDSDGNLLVVTQSDMSSVDYAMDVAIGPLGDVYVVGATLGGNYPDEDLYVAKYDADCQEIWFRQRGTATTDEVANGVAVDDDGHVFVTGATQGGLDGHANQGGWDAIVLRYDEDGTWAWTNQRGSTADDFGTAIAAPAQGGPVTVGWSEGDLDGNANTGGTDFFLMKHGPAGSWRWTRHTGSAGAESYYANAIAVGPGDDAYVAGEIFLVVPESPDHTDALAMKFDDDGYRR